jgi:amidase
LALLKPFRDSIYKQSINTIIKLGGTVVEYEPEPMSFDFWNHTYCRHESRSPNYLNTYASNEVTSRSIAEIVAYNNSDAALKSPMVKAVLMVCYPTKPLAELVQIKAKVKKAGVQF